MKKVLPLVAISLLLSACYATTAQDPGYVCMTNCAHECPDGNKGTQCRIERQRQLDEQRAYYEQNRYYNPNYKGYYDPRYDRYIDGRYYRYYDGTTYYDAD
ncbi:MAG: hypothetical protein WAO98_00825 [Alphaproteobacteria bacterium]